MNEKYEIEWKDGTIKDGLHGPIIYICKKWMNLSVIMNKVQYLDTATDKALDAIAIALGTQRQVLLDDNGTKPYRTGNVTYYFETDKEMKERLTWYLNNFGISEAIAKYRKEKAATNRWDSILE